MPCATDKEDIYKSPCILSIQLSIILACRCSKRRAPKTTDPVINTADMADDATPMTHMAPCTACSNDVDLRGSCKLRCGHFYCGVCLDSLFSIAMREETADLPRCCGLAIPVESVRRHLSKRLVRDYQNKQLELSTRDRTYCHVPTCSAFIAPHSIHNGEAIC